MRRIVIFMVLVLGTTSVFAQLNFGAKAGVNFASISGDGTDGLDGRTSFHFGGLVEIELTDMFALQPEVLFSSQGAKEEGTESEFGSTYSYKDVYKLNYLNLPVMLKVYVVDGFAFELGPQLGFLISATDSYEFSGEGTSESGDEDIKDELKGTDIGAGFGASYKLDNGLFFSGRYVLGFSDIFEETLEGTSPRNNVIQFSLGWLFN